jgi:hypothetical protein
MLAARLSVERGINPAAAIAKVRAVRDGAVETHVQEEWVKAGVPGLRCRRLGPDSSGLKGAEEHYGFAALAARALVVGPVEARGRLLAPVWGFIRRSGRFGSAVLATVAPGKYDPIRLSIC